MNKFLIFASLFLLTQVCLSQTTCPDGEFYDADFGSGRCRDCTINCKKCTDSGLSDCTECRTDKYKLENGRCVYQADETDAAFAGGILFICLVFILVPICVPLCVCCCVICVIFLIVKLASDSKPPPVVHTNPNYGHPAQPQFSSPQQGHMQGQPQPVSKI